MTRLHSLGLAVALLASTTGCRGTPPAASHAAPATVSHPVKESDLTSITLTEAAEARLGIRTEVAEVKEVRRTRTFGGEAVVPPDQTIVVVAPVTSVVAAVGTDTGGGRQVVAGVSVDRGQPLMRLLPLAPADRDIRIEAERALADTDAKLDVTRKRAARAEQLLRDGSGSRRALEEATAELATLEAAAKAARERVALVARSPLDPGGGVTMASPIAGRVVSVHAVAGQTVAAGTPLVEVVRLDRVWVRVPVYVGDRAALDLDRGAEIVGLGASAASKPIPATLVPSPLAGDPASASLTLLFEASNAGAGLQPGQRVGVRISLRGGERALTVPEAALLYDARGDGWVYEQVREHVFARRRVEVRSVVDGLVVIARGIEPGVRVVTDGAAELFGTEFGVGK